MPRTRPGGSVDADRSQVDEVVALLERELGDDLVAAYLYGSWVLGGLRPSSDVDVFGVLRRPLTEAERAALVDGLLEFSGRRARRGPARPVELTLAVHDELRPWRYPPQREFQYGEWLRDGYEAGGMPRPGSDADLAVLVTMVLQRGIGLRGSPAVEVLDEVPPGDLRRAIVEGVPGLVDELADDTRNVVLTLARVWLTLATGEIVAKDDAAEWAAERLPAGHREVVLRARAIYLGEVPEDGGEWSDLAARVAPCVERLVAEIAEEAARG